MFLMDVTERDLWVVLITLIVVGAFAVCFAIWRNYRRFLSRSEADRQAHLWLTETLMRFSEISNKVSGWEKDHPDFKEAERWAEVRNEILTIMESINVEHPHLCIELMPYWEPIRSGSGDHDSNCLGIQMMNMKVGEYRRVGVNRTAVKLG